MTKETTIPKHGKLSMRQMKNPKRSKAIEPTTASSAQTQTDIVLPLGPHISFVDFFDAKGNEKPLNFGVDMHYFFDASALDDHSMVSHHIDKAVKKNRENASATHVELFDGVSLEDIQPSLKGAIEYALQHKNGYLTLDLVGATLPNIEPEAYAKMLGDLIFSLPKEQSQKLVIVLPVNTATHPQHMSIQKALRLSLAMHRMRALISQGLNLSPNDNMSAEYINSFIDMLTGLISSECFEHLEKYFIICANSIDLQYNKETKCSFVTEFQQQNFLNDMHGVGNFVINTLIKPLYLIENGKIKGVVDDFAEVFRRQAVAAVACAFDEHLSLNGFLGQRKNGLPVQPMGQMLELHDIQGALYHLAIKYPKNADALLDVKVVTRGSLDAALQSIITRDSFPRHIIVHSASKDYSEGGHWTRIVVTKASDGRIVQRTIDSLQTGDQKDGWTCGYHALTGVLRGIVSENRTHPCFSDWTKEELNGIGLPEISEHCPDGVPNSNLRINGRERTKALVNWLLKLIFSSEYAHVEHEVEVQSVSESALGHREPPLKNPAIDALIDAHLKAIGQIDAEHDCKAKLSRIAHIEASMQEMKAVLEAKDSTLLSPEFYLAYDRKLKDFKCEVNQLLDLLTDYLTYAEDNQRQHALLLRLQALIERQNVLAGLLEMAKQRKLVADPKQKKMLSCETAAVRNPMLTSLDVLHDKEFIEPALKESMPKVLSAAEEHRYQILMSKVLASELNERLPKLRHGLEKKRMINIAIREVDYAIIDAMLNKALAQILPDEKQTLDTHSKYLKLKNEYKSIKERNHTATTADLKYQGQLQLIEMYLNRIAVDDEKFLQLKREDPDRRKALLAAFDDRESTFFKALNSKRSSFCGISFTFFSGASWCEMINGDSQVVKNMKAADKLLHTSQLMATDDGAVELATQPW